MIWKYQLITESGELISRHKTYFAAQKAAKYIGVKTTIKEIN